MNDATSQQNEAPPIVEMRRMLARVAGFLEQAEYPVGSAAMCLNSFRGRLTEIYGKESTHLANLPLISTGGDRDAVRALIKQRHALCERILAALESLPGAIQFPNAGRRVFIGHGRSPVWRELKDFLVDRMRLPWDEFNREPTAGLATVERLNEMLENACFAFLIMTAEEEHADSSVHARPNVIHEVGLFQGRLGMRRAIVLLEDGCAEFSNIVGLTQIRFAKGHISSCFEEIRRVLEREKLA